MGVFAYKILVNHDRFELFDFIIRINSLGHRDTAFFHSVNYLLIESLQKYHHYYGDTLKIEYPTGSGRMETLGAVATDLSTRLIRLFLRDGNGRRPVYGGQEQFQKDPYWKDLILFHEYFHGDNGAGLGASHQTGWTALVAKLIQQSGTRRPS